MHEICSLESNLSSRHRRHENKRVSINLNNFSSRIFIIPMTKGSDEYAYIAFCTLDVYSSSTFVKLYTVARICACLHWPIIPKDELSTRSLNSHKTAAATVSLSDKVSEKLYYLLLRECALSLSFLLSLLIYIFEI